MTKQELINTIAERAEINKIDVWKIQCKMPPKTKKILPPENIQ